MLNAPVLLPQYKNPHCSTSRALCKRGKNKKHLNKIFSAALDKRAILFFVDNFAKKSRLLNIG